MTIIRGEGSCGCVSCILRLVTDPNRTQALTVDPNRTMMGTAPTIDATVTIKPVQCPVCKQFNPPGVMFCVDCGLIFDRALPDDAFGAPAIQLPMLVESSGREHPIRAGSSVVGREADIAIPDSRVSRRHAQITSEDGVFYVEDLGSTNGTTLNGTAVSGRVTFGTGDAVAFGGVEVKLRLPGQQSGGVTQSFPSNRTAAMPAVPKLEAAPATLVGDGVEYPLKAGQNTFGRKSDSDVQITDPYVSGRHGIIEIAADGFFLTDVGSTNGTLLNDAKMAANMRTRITSEDVIRLGGLELRVLPSPSPSAPTPGDSEGRSPHPPAPSPSAQTSDREGEPE